MGITNSNKQINVSRIDCQGMLKVTLALSAAPDISSNPTDIALHGGIAPCQYESRSKDVY